VKLTIWQGFSSNHSSRFTVVGVFESPEKAAQAAKVFTDLRQAVTDWYNQPENAAARQDWAIGEFDPTPPELALAERMQIAWGFYAADWLWVGMADHEPVEVVDSLLILDGTESEAGAHPADRLIERLGGRAVVNGAKDDEGDETIAELSLTCLAPSEAAAEHIEHVVTDLDIRPDASLPNSWPHFIGPPGASILAGQLQRDGRTLSITCQFYHIATSLQGLLTYLHDHGCTDIRYNFTEKPLPED
jgi:hypothetical protein